MKAIKLAMVVFSAFSLQTSFAATAQTFLCNFENALVPCNKLKRPIAIWAYSFNYLPAKWTPLWPNQFIFGGRRPEITPWNANFNLAIPFNSQIETIENMSLRGIASDENFIDLGLANTTEWQDITAKGAVRLVDIDKAFRGAELFDAWQNSTKLGIACRDHKEDYYLGPRLERHCAFSRLITNSSKNTTNSKIEYCAFDVDPEMEIRGTPYCTLVASQTGTSRKILSARYTAYNFSGGDYAGEFRCTLKTDSLEDLQNRFADFIKGYLGESSKFRMRKVTSEVVTIVDQSEFRAEGINIDDKEERMFVRVTLSGNFDRADRESEFRVSVNVWITVSAQSSDNIIDYREPSPAMTDRIRNRFESQLKRFMKAVSPKAICKLDL